MLGMMFSFLLKYLRLGADPLLLFTFFRYLTTTLFTVSRCALSPPIALGEMSRNVAAF